MSKSDSRLRVVIVAIEFSIVILFYVSYIVFLKRNRKRKKNKEKEEEKRRQEKNGLEVTRPSDVYLVKYIAG